MSDEWNICVLFVETVFDVSHNRDNKASAEQMHHPIKDRLFKLQLQCLMFKLKKTEIIQWSVAKIIWFELQFVSFSLEKNIHLIKRNNITLKRTSKSSKDDSNTLMNRSKACWWSRTWLVTICERTKLSTVIKV